MTYDGLKSITSGLLIGDNVLPKEEDVLRGLVQYALTTVATQADSLHLMTLDTSGDIMRSTQGNYLIRMPEVPEDGVDLIDIDEELAFAVARYLASYVSKSKGGIHVQAASRIIKDYNSKVWALIEESNMIDETTGKYFDNITTSDQYGQLITGGSIGTV